VIMVRTDALANEGLAAAIERGRRSGHDFCRGGYRACYVCTVSRGCRRAHPCQHN
jgi:hypothetical protein